MSLNEQQSRAVLHGDGPLLVLAGPGSGKTRVVTHRIARLVEQGVPARSILAVTFTNKAAREMRQRVRQLAGSAATGLLVTTIHSACVRILREEIAVLGYGKNFTIYDEGSQVSLLRAVLRDLAPSGVTASSSRVLSDLSARKSGLDPRAVVSAPPGQAADGEDADAAEVLAARAEAERSDARHAEVGERYEEELRARNAIDFDDIICLTARLFREHPAVLARWQERFRHVLVDEYQDTNSPQDEVLCLLAGAGGNLCVVGDDDQSVYAFRGAEVGHILSFPERHAGTAVVRLERNYRSTGHVVGAAAAVIARNRRRHAKSPFTRREDGERVRIEELPDDREEAEFIAASIAREVHGPGGDVWKEAGRHAILVRTNEQARPFEVALRQCKVPYRILGGRSFFDRKEVLDVVAYLRLARDRSDAAALLRIINVPARGVGAKGIEALRAEAAARGETEWDVLARLSTGFGAPPELSLKSVGALGDLVDAVEAAATAAGARAPGLVDELLRRIDYRAEVDRGYKDVAVRESRWALASEMQASWAAHLAGGEPGDPLDSFLDSLVLGERDDDVPQGGGVTLATVHASKGLEFDVVHVAGLEDGTFPHSRSVDDAAALEEERRLFYVAMTRARDRLVLTRALTRTLRGKSRETVASRFLDELPGEHVAHGDPNAVASSGSVAGFLSNMRAVARAGAAGAGAGAGTQADEPAARAPDALPD